MYPTFLISALDSGERAASLPGERALGTYWVGGLMGVKAGMDAVEKIKVPATAGNPTPSVQPVAHRSTDGAIPVHVSVIVIIITRVDYIKVF